MAKLHSKLSRIYQQCKSDLIIRFSPLVVSFIVASGIAVIGYIFTDIIIKLFASWGITSAINYMTTIDTVFPRGLGRIPVYFGNGFLVIVSTLLSIRCVRSIGHEKDK